MDKFILRMIYSGLSAVKMVIFRCAVLYMVVFSRIQVAEHRDVFQSKSEKLMLFTRTPRVAARAAYGSLPTSFIMSALLLLKYTELLYAKTMEVNADNLFRS